MGQEVVQFIRSSGGSMSFGSFSAKVIAYIVLSFRFKRSHNAILSNMIKVIGS